MVSFLFVEQLLFFGVLSVVSHHFLCEKKSALESILSTWHCILPARFVFVCLLRAFRVCLFFSSFAFVPDVFQPYYIYI